MRAQNVPIFIRLWPHDGWETWDDDPNDFDVVFESVIYDVPVFGYMLVSLSNATSFFDRRDAEVPVSMTQAAAVDLLKSFGGEGFWATVTGEIIVHENANVDNVAYAEREATKPGYKRSLEPWTFAIECSSLTLFEPRQPTDPTPV